MNRQKRILALILVLVLVLALSGCGKSDPSKALIGKWQAVSCTYLGEETLYLDELVGVGFYTFKKDGTFEYGDEVESGDGSWKVVGDFICAVSNDSPLTWYYEIQGKKLTLTVISSTYSDGIGTEMVFKKK